MKTRDITFTAMMIALAVIFEFISSIIPFLQMPQGGHPTLAAIPLVVLGYKKGIIYGMLGGIIAGTIQMSPYAVNPIQYLLDYTLAFMFMGMGSIFLNIFNPSDIYKKNISLILGIVVAMSLRFLCHFFSGLFYFRGESTWWAGAVYSATYNFPYILVTSLITIYFSIILIAKLENIPYFNAEKKSI